ncbi:MAG: hypothetical protein H6R10_2088 [Rhodocyclaceae bacterium]|nr:hypothetical protein [Rhodocyclaceae bacterium]
MHEFFRKYRILGGVILVLAAGFLATRIATYSMAPQTSANREISDRALLLTGNNIHAEIQKNLQLPIFVSSLMANDTFVRNWILGGERDTDPMARYLNEVKQQYGLSTTFLVSERSRRYYRGNSAPNAVPTGDSGEGWFFRVRAMKDAYETSADMEIAEGNHQTLAVSHRIVDSQDNFIGIAGAGFTLDPIIRFIGSLESRFRCSIYLVDRNGIILNGKSAMQHLRDHPGLRQVAADILSSPATPIQASFRLGDGTFRIDSRLIPELGWHLVVEQRELEGAQPAQPALYLNLASGAAGAGLALSLFFLAGRYQRRQDNGPAIDTVTGLMNRQAYEFVFQQTLLEINRGNQPLSLVLLELDLPARIVSSLGRKTGDRIMRGLAQLARKAVRNSDPVSRWSGEQILIQLRDCPRHEAIAVAERLRISIASYNFGLKDPRQVVTISLGVAQYLPQEPGDAFLQRARDALDQAKAKGRNRVEPEIPEDGIQ